MKKGGHSPDDRFRAKLSAGYREILDLGFDGTLRVEIEPTPHPLDLPGIYETEKRGLGDTRFFRLSGVKDPCPYQGGGFDFFRSSHCFNYGPI